MWEAPLSNHFITILPRLLTCLIALQSCLAAEENRKPNILWIFSDDHAYQAIGAYGGRFGDFNLTPNIDRIATNSSASMATTRMATARNGSSTTSRPIPTSRPAPTTTGHTNPKLPNSKPNCSASANNTRWPTMLAAFPCARSGGDSRISHTRWRGGTDSRTWRFPMAGGDGLWRAGRRHSGDEKAFDHTRIAHPHPWTDTGFSCAGKAINGLFGERGCHPAAPISAAPPRDVDPPHRSSHHPPRGHTIPPHPTHG